ncbi:MAG: helix-turn-helix transcriptional regulator [Flavobacteriales bacterium]|jgi:AraC-like DNA-binding protein|nr:helix-turn-helix transcriptional regulator [Flavobacteriales bacterium]
MPTLHIKHMVCDRCVMAVRDVLDELAIPAKHVGLGEVVLERAITAAERAALDAKLGPLGFARLDDRNGRLIERIKAAVVQLVHHDHAERGRTKLSTHVATAVGRDYSTLSALFSQVEGITIEQYFLLQRLERVKELIRYDELSLSEIAFRTGFSSVAHLSGQFKQLTGMTPTAFRAMAGGRTPLDQVG